MVKFCMIMLRTIITNRSSLLWRTDGDVKKNSYCIVRTLFTCFCSEVYVLDASIHPYRLFLQLFYEHYLFRSKEETCKVFLYGQSFTFSLVAPHTEIKLNNSYATFVLKVYHPMKRSVCSPNWLKLCCQHSHIGPEVLTSAAYCVYGSTRL